MRRARARRDSACHSHRPRTTEATQPCGTHASSHGTSNTDTGSVQVSMHAGVHTHTHSPTRQADLCPDLSPTTTSAAIITAHAPPPSLGKCPAGNGAQEMRCHRPGHTLGRRGVGAGLSGVLKGCPLPLSPNSPTPPDCPLFSGSVPVLHAHSQGRRTAPRAWTGGGLAWAHVRVRTSRGPLSQLPNTPHCP